MPDAVDRFLFAVEGVQATLRVVRFSATEGMSRLFHIEIDVASEDATLDFGDVLRQKAQLSIPPADGDPRYLCGIVSRLTQLETGEKLAAYRIEVVPRVWLLSLRSDCRIFQNLTAPDIIKAVLEGAGLSAGDDFRLSLRGTYSKREYCVQYRESDLDFICRLMEEEGIFYFFEFAEEKHTLILADLNTACSPIGGNSTLKYRPRIGELGLAGEGEDVTRFEFSGEVQSDKMTLREYNFLKPALDQEGAADSHLAGLEVYDYPVDGQVANGPSVDGVTNPRAKIRLEHARMLSQEGSGESECPRLTGGSIFSLDEFRRESLNGKYLLTEVSHRGREPALVADFGLQEAGGTDQPYLNEFRCIPAQVPYRPARATPRAAVWGTQTAIVVGPAGEEIYTDEHGRIKVQFHWDRLGKNDDKSSCWIRVGTPWAQEAWGIIHIPRVGQEVIVAFEEGDPDKPIVVGCVYHGTNVVPYSLPSEKTKSGIKSRSTPKGDTDKYNELIFEDKKGSELIAFHAEKDFHRVVENNDMLEVGHDKKDKGDQTIDIFNNQDLTVGGGKDKCDDGSQTITVWNSQTLAVGKGEGQAKVGSQTITIYKDRTATLKTGDDTLTITQGNQSIQISKGSCTVEAMQSITLKVGDNSITIDTSGVTIKGMNVSAEAKMQLSLKGGSTGTLDGGGNLTIKGGMVKIN